MTSKTKTKKVGKKLQDYLTLNKFISSFFGLSKIEDFRDSLRDIEEGLNQNKRFHFTEKLKSLDISVELRLKLDVYDDNIQSYLKIINAKRTPAITLKYFQYLAVLFVEIYLDQLNEDFDFFKSKFNKFVIDLNEKENKMDSYVYPLPEDQNIRKLCLWSATGSGKTIIMHFNILQISKYVDSSIDNILLITPNENLTSQHIEELTLSSIENEKFSKNLDFGHYRGENPVKVIEIYKIREELTSKDGVTIPVEAFGNKNIIFVDEGHKGHSSEAKTWTKLRKKLVGIKGFTFEYSATFGEISDNDDVFNEYASTIYFDFRYKYFYEDGFGKDYSILNLKKFNSSNVTYFQDEYFTGAMVAFYEQKLYFKHNESSVKPFKIENPLMIFVGTSVTGKKTSSDILFICKFIADFISNKIKYSEIIQKILDNDVSLLDENDQPIYHNKFLYLKNLLSSKKIHKNDIYTNILMNLFHSKVGNKIKLSEMKNADGEIGLQIDDEFFGLINIGDISAFLKLAEKESFLEIGPPSQLKESFFYNLDKKDSTINFLIGSKKFIEGWNSFRVSSMGLLNIGKNQGTQIIQLFGRGVRLKGFNNLLKRSSALILEQNIDLEVEVPEYLYIVETLNIFGLNADYMAKFREILKEDGIEVNEIVSIKTTPTQISRQLYSSSTKKKLKHFTDEFQIIGLNADISKIILDLSTTVEIIDSGKFESQNKSYSKSSLDHYVFDSSIIQLFDFQKIFISMLKYKELKGYYNLYFTMDDLREVLNNKDKYSIHCHKELIILKNTDELKKLFKIEEYAIQLLKSYFDKLYNHYKATWLQETLQPDIFTKKNDLPFSKE